MSDRTGIQDKPLVLFADADESHGELVRYALEQDGFRVAFAKTGKAALEEFLRTPPDVVLLDVDLPGLDGIEVCRTMRSRESKRETPILIITSHDAENFVGQAFDAGATDFIVKPLAPALIAHRIRHVLRMSKSLNDLRGGRRSAAGPEWAGRSAHAADQGADDGIQDQFLSM